MKKIVKLTERDLSNIVKRVISEQGHTLTDFDYERINSGEDMTYTQYKGDLRTDIMKMIHNSNSPNEDIIRTLRSIVDEMESAKRVRKGAQSRWNK